MKNLDTKRTAFVGLLSALGIVLSAISLNIAPIVGNAAFDLSHIATFIAAIFGGPIAGATVGLLGGLYAGYHFGFVYGQGPIALIATPIGKAMTGLTAGLLYKKLRIASGSGRSVWVVPATLVAYIPECIFTILYFLYIAPFVLGHELAFVSVPVVIAKAWIEIIVMSIIMGALAGNAGFKEFIKRFLHVHEPRKSMETSVEKQL